MNDDARFTCSAPFAFTRGRTAAAVTNAVFHATGRRIRELPVRLEKLLV